LSTPIHAKYYANELMLRKPSSSDSRLSNALFDSKLAINPHQIDAALFAFKSPLSKGVLLADEVGLGKTIEAGLVMCQLWAERKRKQIVICPASLRKQWNLELLEKFNLESVILESKSYNEYMQQGGGNPFDQNKIVITSYHFAARMSADIVLVPFDIVVIDEAHKLRNSYKEKNKLGQAIRFAVNDRKKLLLTATPLQNSLIELYGISSVIDGRIFGDLKTYRDNYISDKRYSELRERLAHFCKRTLRKDVVEYIKYTERLPMVQRFTNSDAEQELYDRLSEFLQVENTYAIPYRQKHLITMQMRKYMASSTFAILKTLETIRDRLVDIQNGILGLDSLIENLFDEDEQDIIDDNAEEEEIEADDEGNTQIDVALTDLQAIDKEKLQVEIKILEEFIELAKGIPVDTKSRALLDALKVSFTQIVNKGGARKALIFTESKRTQEYLKNFLEQSEYSGKIVVFNGSNSGAQASQIYKDWKEVNANSFRISGSATADKRNSITDYFKNTAEIMIATEAAAEGVNLQFCSLVINYDLPWNPQRIEQRIGRCHRYGQKSDVVVVNFINERNYADIRVHELLDEKLHLFNGIFGSSDEVLGSIESGVDFEKRILEIYQKCRTPEEIENAFNALQKQVEHKIKKAMKETKSKLFENFDTDVFERLKLSVSDYLDKFTRLFWNLTKHELEIIAEFDDAKRTFVLKSAVGDNLAAKYSLINKSDDETEGFLYRLSHPLGQYVLEKGKSQAAKTGKVIFNFTRHIRDKGFKISQVEQLKNQRGFLTLYKYTVNSFEEAEHLLFAGFTQDGVQLSPEQCEKLFECAGTYYDFMPVSEDAHKKLAADIEVYRASVLDSTVSQNLKFMEVEQERLFKWSEDMIYAIEKELTNLKNQIRDTEKEIRNSTSAAEKLALEKRLLELSKRKRTLRAKLDENEEEIIEKRTALINEIKKRMQTIEQLEELFTIQWEVT